jgi:hypothetical protein
MKWVLNIDWFWFSRMLLHLWYHDLLSSLAVKAIMVNRQRVFLIFLVASNPSISGIIISIKTIFVFIIFRFAWMPLKAIISAFIGSAVEFLICHLQLIYFYLLKISSARLGADLYSWSVVVHFYKKSNIL